MIKKPQELYKKMNNKEVFYRVTPTLLNSWQYIFDCEKYVKESETDEVAYETKLELAQEKAKQDFVNLLNRIPIPDNEAMRKGREFEDLVCNGLDEEFSPIVYNGAFQVKATKKVFINDIPIVLYGVLDVLKAGRIYDIKRVGKYSYPKYLTSHQHTIYLELFPNTYDFTYLIRDDNNDSHFENYTRENCENIYEVIRNFISYLKNNDLFEVFTAKWAMNI